MFSKKNKIRYLIFAIVAISALLMSFAFTKPKLSTQPVNVQHEHGTSAQSAASKLKQQVERKSDPVGTIYGDINPELIPDSVAYNLFFHSLVATNGTAGSYNPSLIKKISKEIELSDENRDKLLQVIHVYQQNEASLDMKAKDLKDKYWPEPSLEVIKKLEDLQAQKDGLILSTFNSLSGKVGLKESKNIQKYVERSFKKNVKIVPDPPDYPSKWEKSISK